MSTASREHAAAFDAEQFARGFHLYNDELQDDPYPVIDRLRAQCPVAQSDAMDGFWVVTRYQDCRFVLQNHGLFSSAQNVIPHAQMTLLGPDIPTQIDPPDHGKYRQILNPLLSPRVVAALEPRMRALATELIDTIVAAGRCDFLADFAVPYPSLIFVPLMGLPESDLNTFLGWKNKILHTTDAAQRAEIFETVNVELQGYFTAVFHERRRREDPGDDLVGQLVAVIGTGSSGVQAIPVIAREAAHLTVFQRTANFSIPARNHPLDDDFRREFKKHYHERREMLRHANFFFASARSARTAAHDELRAEYQARWEAGGPAFMAAFGDLLLDQEANDTAAEFVRAKIREIVRDPEAAGRLIPQGFPDWRQAPVHRHRLFRHLQPRQRHARRRQRHPDRGDHAHGNPDQHREP